MKRKGNSCAPLMVMSIGTATMENIHRGSSKIRNKTHIWSSNSTSGYLYKESKNTNSERYMHPDARCNVIYNSQDTAAT